LGQVYCDQVKRNFFQCALWCGVENLGNMKAKKQVRTDYTFRLIVLVFILALFFQAVLFFSSHDHSSSGSLWFNPHLRAETDAATHAQMVSEAAAVPWGRILSLNESLAQGKPLSAGSAMDGWLLAAYERLSEPNGRQIFGGSLPWIVYFATPWFGNPSHKWAREGKLFVCPQADSPPCTIGFYSSPHRPLGSRADVALYFSGSGPSERTSPPAWNSNLSSSLLRRPLHTLLFAENLAVLHSPPFAARFDAEISYRKEPSSVLRDEEYLYTALEVAAGGGDHDPDEISLSEHSRLVDFGSLTWNLIFPLSHPSPFSDRFSIFAVNASTGKRGAIVSWAASHCRSRSGREELVAALEEFGLNVDVWGPWSALQLDEIRVGQATGSSSCCLCAPWRHAGEASEEKYLLDTSPWSKQSQLFRRYKFYLALENTRCKDYVTEKALLSLARGVVPIVLSAPNVRDYLPPGSYIDVSSFASVAALVEYIFYLDTHPEAYLAYFRWRDAPFSSWSSSPMASGLGSFPGSSFFEALRSALLQLEAGASSSEDLYSCSICGSLEAALGDEGQVKTARSSVEDRRSTLLSSIFQRRRGGPVRSIQCAPPMEILGDENATMFFPGFNESSKQPPPRPTFLPRLVRAVSQRAAECVSRGWCKGAASNPAR